MYNDCSKKIVYRTGCSGASIPIYREPMATNAPWSILGDEQKV